MTKWAILLPVLAAAALPDLARGVRGEDELSVREVHARIVDAYNHEDTDRLTEHLHPDVAHLIPSRPAIEGKDAVRAIVVTVLLSWSATAQSQDARSFAVKRCNEDGFELRLDPGPFQEVVGSDYAVVLEDGKARVAEILSNVVDRRVS